MLFYIRRHIIAVFFFLTYLFSWGIWLWVNETGSGLSGWIGLIALLGAFGPSVVGLICSGLLDDWNGVRALLRRVIAWRVHWIVYLAVLLGPILLAMTPICINTLLGGPVPHWKGLLRLPELLPTALKMLLIGGLTEELGWRGFCLPVLRQQRGRLVASLVIGLVWGLWHLPIYSLPTLGTPLPAEELIKFILGTIPLAIFFTALADQSRDSVWIAILFHAWMNTFFYEVAGLLGIPSTDQLRFLNQLTWFVAAALIIWSWRRPAQPSIRNMSSIGDQEVPATG
jgi:membrane protease YdiL (CAAX protease family)